MRLKNNLLKIVMMIFITIITFAFLSFVNWSFNFQEWNGFSRFILGLVGIGIVVKSIGIGIVVKSIDII